MSGRTATAVALGMLLAMAPVSRAQDGGPERIVSAIRSHLEAITPELTRYSRLTTFGETISDTAISNEGLARERSLYEDAVAAGLMKSPRPEVLALGHNLIVHDPASGLAYLKALHESSDLGAKDVAQAIVVATLACGEPGERMAVSQLQSKDRGRRSFWAHYLEYYAMYLSSTEPIEKLLSTESESSIKASLLRALSMIGSPGSLTFIREMAERETDDAVQAAAIFAYAELAGHGGMTFVESLKPLGPQAARELQTSRSWLMAETRPDSKHGREVSNDSGFVRRFAGLRSSPVMRWLNEEGLLQEEARDYPQPLDAGKKAHLLDLLVDSKGFGFEAVKGTLYRSLSKEDEPQLLRIRAVGFYSPNEMSRARSRTIGIMIRQIRQELQN